MDYELRDLTRRLRRRVEQSHRSCWKLPVPPAVGRAARLAALAAGVRACRGCPLGETRAKAVFGAGSPRAEVLCVGEGPGREEDLGGEPFAGPAGELLDRILASIGLSRLTVYLTDVVKCRPMDERRAGEGRAPAPLELAACRPHLQAQIRALAPRVILALGSVAARALLGRDEPIDRLRGTWQEYRDGDFTAKLLATYHPADLLRDPELKKEVWKDMKALRSELQLL